MSLLEVDDIEVRYGAIRALKGVTFHVDEGEVVTLLGRNGAGRTSTLRAIMGLIGSRKGSIKVRGTETVGMATHRIARLGQEQPVEPLGAGGAGALIPVLILRRPAVVQRGHGAGAPVVGGQDRGQPGAAQRVGRRLPERSADCHDALRRCGLGQASGGPLGDQGYPDAGSRPQLRVPGSGAVGEE